jgi:hypothetical protein
MKPHNVLKVQPNELYWFKETGYYLHVLDTIERPIHKFDVDPLYQNVQFPHVNGYKHLTHKSLEICLPDHHEPFPLWNFHYELIEIGHDKYIEFLEKLVEFKPILESITTSI